METEFLYQRSDFFVDAINVLFYGDVFIFHELEERIKVDPVTEYLFKDSVENIRNIINESNSANPEMDLIMLTSQKKHINILEDWIDMVAFETLKTSVSINTYLSKLYMDIFTDPITKELFQITEFGNALKLLSKDSNFHSLAIYLPFGSHFIVQELSSIFDAGLLSKTTIVIGKKKKEFIEDNTHIQSYVFENIADVDEYLTFHHISLKEVLIPTYEYNMVKRDEMEKSVEQVMYQRLNLKEWSYEYKEKYNISINSISVPI